MSDSRRTALVIASAQGIGLATCKRMARDGYALCMVDMNEEKLAAAAEELRQDGAEVVARAGNALEQSDIASAVKMAMDAYGRIDAMACVAGGAGGIPMHQIDDISQDHWEKVVNLNLSSTYIACHHVVPIMRKQRHGRIVCLSSTVAKGRFGPVGTMGARLPYATAKAGILGFVKQLAKDVGRDGITVNAVLPWLTFGGPGTKIVEAFNSLDDEYQTRTMSLSPQGRAVTADGVAAVINFLLSQEAEFVSGVALPVDGAYLN
ncbi:SDR family NAD(P)-dependent oxidoreductase [Oricola sp.]|uniref:SDR family NAD(P)-dependent oxidoreductase n=1 Tax=Oricola sp. TaxID=1979950 RepID=UPI003BAC77D8